MPVDAIFHSPFAEQVAFFRQKLGNLIPTERWTDVKRSEHDRGVMVAGAMKADLLSDLAAAIDKTIAQGGTLEGFRKDFAAAVQRTGWDYTGSFDWRTRVIYQTNMRTSYAAGRLAQLQRFAYWMYKHGDPAEPRPLHLAWNGMVLPADHAFWKSHYPPNGWGCTCRAVGVRRPEDASRIGGDPEKALDPAWEKIDPKTGEPVGVDRGWGYMPGSTVSDTVRTMAAKTQQWEYSLAKSYMQAVPETVRDDLAQAYRGLPSVADDVRRYAQRVIEGKSDVAPYVTLGLLTEADASRIGALTRTEPSLFDFAIDQFVPLHVRGEHAGGGETERGQRPITASDYGRLPKLLNAPDAIEDAGPTWKTGRPAVLVRKRFSAEQWESIWEVREGRKMLALVSFWVKKVKSP